MLKDVPQRTFKVNWIVEDMDDQEQPLARDQISPKLRQDQNKKETIKNGKMTQGIDKNIHFKYDQFNKSVQDTKSQEVLQEEYSKVLQQNKTLECQLKKYKKFSKRIIKFVDLLRKYYFQEDYNQIVDTRQNIQAQNLQNNNERNKVKQITRILYDKQKNLTNQSNSDRDVNQEYNNNFENNQNAFNYDEDENDCYIVENNQEFQQFEEQKQVRSNEAKKIQSNYKAQSEQNLDHNIQEATHILKEDSLSNDSFESQQDYQEFYKREELINNKKKYNDKMEDGNSPIIEKRIEIQQTSGQKQQKEEEMRKIKIKEKKKQLIDIKLTIEDLDQFDFQNMIVQTFSSNNMKQIHIIPATKDLQKLKKMYFNRFHLSLNQFVVLYYKCRVSENEINIILIKLTRQMWISKDQIKSVFGEAYIYRQAVTKNEFLQIIKICRVLENRQTMFYSNNHYQIDNIPSTAQQNELIGNGLLIKYANISNFQELLEDLLNIYFVKILMVKKMSTKTIICYMKHSKEVYIFHYEEKEFECICRDMFSHNNLEYIQTLNKQCTIHNAIRLLNELSAGNQIIWYPQNFTIPEDYEYNHLKSSFKLYQNEIFSYKSLIQEQATIKEKQQKRETKQQSIPKPWMPELLKEQKTNE